MIPFVSLQLLLFSANVQLVKVIILSKQANRNWCDTCVKILAQMCSRGREGPCLGGYDIGRGVASCWAEEGRICHYVCRPGIKDAVGGLPEEGYYKGKNIVKYTSLALCSIAMRAGDV